MALRAMDLEPEGIIPPDLVPPPGVDPVIADIELALDQGREEEALALAEEALAAGQGDRLDLLFLAGDALLALGSPAAAEARFREVLAIDPDCPGTRCWLAMALYRQCRLVEAEAATAAALALPDPVSDAHVVKGLLLERHGDYRGADACFKTAAKLDPIKHQAPHRLSRQQFDREVDKAIKKLPKEFRKHLDAVPVVIEDLPDESFLIGEDGGVNDPDLMGMFVGVPLGELGDGLMGGESVMNSIHLFQRNIERAAKDVKDLVEQIRITLYHELGHYLGFDEDGLDRIGLA